VVTGFLSVCPALLFYELYPLGLMRARSRWEVTYHIGVVGVVEESA